MSKEFIDYCNQLINGLGDGITSPNRITGKIKKFEELRAVLFDGLPAIKVTFAFGDALDDLAVAYGHKVEHDYKTEFVVFEFRHPFFDEDDTFCAVPEDEELSHDDRNELNRYLIRTIEAWRDAADTKTDATETGANWIVVRIGDCIQNRSTIGRHAEDANNSDIEKDKRGTVRIQKTMLQTYVKPREIGKYLLQ